MDDGNGCQRSGFYCMLSEDELNAIVGGDGKTAPPAAKPTSRGLFEINDYSFDIEQVL